MEYFGIAFILNTDDKFYHKTALNRTMKLDQKRIFSSLKHTTEQIVFIPAR